MRATPSPRPLTSRPFSELLQTAIRALREQEGDKARDSVLFLGNRHQSFPVMVLEDPILEPVDKIIWMVIWQRGAGGGTRALFPSYAEISATAHVGSDTTIARALAILRATRWLSLCARVRGKHGTFRGNVYAIHDEPLALADTLHLDPGYLKFLDASKSHSHLRVRKVALSALASLDEDIRAGLDVAAPPHAISRRLEAARAIANPGAFRYFSFTPAVLKDLINARDAAAEGDRLHDLETADQLQDLETVCSSSNLNITTTTQDLTPTPAREAEPVYPPGLAENERLLARRYLERVPIPDRQAVLDELEGRLRAARKGAKPLYDPIRYLHRLCVEFTQGRFVVNLGSQVEAERRRRVRPEAREAPANVSGVSPTSAPSKIGKTPGTSPVDAIRRQFNLPSKLKTPP